jgi:hypothetical protein
MKGLAPAISATTTGATTSGGTTSSETALSGSQGAAPISNATSTAKGRTRRYNEARSE